MINNFPILIKEVELGTLGFYELISCEKCAYSGLSKDKVIIEGELLPTPLSKQLIVGNLYHDLIAFSGSCESESAFNELCSETIKNLDTTYEKFINKNKLGPIRTWSACSKIQKFCLNKMYKNNDRKSCQLSYSKKLFFSKDNRFKGIPDFLYIDENTAYITEYKSSSLYEEGEIKSEYIDQIIFYALLVKDNFPDIDTFLCKLQSLSGESEDLEFSENALEEYRHNFLSRYESIKIMINEGVKNFSSDNCIPCNKKHICKEFISDCTNIKSDKPIYVISGVVEFFSYDHLFIKGEKIVVSNFEDTLSKIKVGSIYTFFNLMKKGGELYYIDGSGVYEH